MVDIEPGQIWHVFAGGRRWERVIVTDIHDGHVKLRYEGVLEFITVELLDMANQPNLFRPVAH